MQCAEAQAFIGTYLDGELDATQSAELERHLAGCAACKRFYESEQALKAALKTDGLYYAAPPGLQTRILRALPAEKSQKAGWGSVRPRWDRAIYGFAASAALFLLALFLLYRPAPVSTAPNDALAQEVVSNHIRSLMASHLFDVQSTDRHTVKPWFDGKIDYAPSVEDMTAQGYPLVGGRLDYLDGRPVAALVYRRQKHIINLYLWPAANAQDEAMRFVSRRGYNLWRWTQAGNSCWAVSDLNSAELQEFAYHLQGRSVTKQH